MDMTLAPDVWDWFPARAIAAGERLACANAMPDCLFVLVSGTVRIEMRGRVVARINQQGAVLGAIGPLRDPAAKMQVVAETDVEVREADGILALCDAKPEVATTIALTIAKRLDELHALVVAGMTVVADDEAALSASSDS